MRTFRIKALFSKPLLRTVEASLLIVFSFLVATRIRADDLPQPRKASTNSGSPITAGDRSLSETSEPPASVTNAASITNEAGLSATNSASSNRMDSLDNKHRLALGDKLSFRIVEDEEDPKPLVVTRFWRSGASLSRKGFLPKERPAATWRTK